MGQAQINVRTRACSRTSIARTRPAALTHNVRGKELILSSVILFKHNSIFRPFVFHVYKVGISLEIQ